MRGAPNNDWALEVLSHRHTLSCYNMFYRNVLDNWKIYSIFKYSYEHPLLELILNVECSMRQQKYEVSKDSPTFLDMGKVWRDWWK